MCHRDDNGKSPSDNLETLHRRVAELEAQLSACQLSLANLNRTAQQLRVVFDHAYELIGLTDPDGTLIMANQYRSTLEMKRYQVPRETVAPATDNPPT